MMLLDRNDHVHWFSQEHSIWSGSFYFSFYYLTLLSLSLSPCLLPHLYYYIYVSAEHAHGIAYYDSHHTNHLTVMSPVPIMRSVNNYS